MQSQSGTLNKKDWKSIGKSLMISVGGAALLALAAWIGNFDWTQLGKYGVYLAPLAPFVVNFLTKLVQGRN